MKKNSTFEQLMSRRRFLLSSSWIQLRASLSAFAASLVPGRSIRSRCRHSSQAFHRHLHRKRPATHAVVSGF